MQDIQLQVLCVWEFCYMNCANCEWIWISDIWCRYLTGFLYFTGANFILTFVASILCVCFAPTAAGPGIPEIKAYLNGVDTPNMYGATTLFVKVKFFMLKIALPQPFNFWLTNHIKEECENVYTSLPCF